MVKWRIREHELEDRELQCTTEKLHKESSLALGCMNSTEIIPLPSPALANLRPKAGFETCRIKERYSKRGEKDQKLHFFLYNLLYFLAAPHQSTCSYMAQPSGGVFVGCPTWHAVNHRTNHCSPFLSCLYFKPDFLSKSCCSISKKAKWFSSWSLATVSIYSAQNKGQILAWLRAGCFNITW